MVTVLVSPSFTGGTRRIRKIWFSFRSRRRIVPDAEGVLRSRGFPGLWIDGRALLAGDGPRQRAVLRQGLSSSEHSAFVRRLQRRHEKLRG
jgi:hypothetical protein